MAPILVHLCIAVAVAVAVVVAAVAQDKAQGTRKYSHIVLNAIADNVPELMGGSADLTGSNNTDFK